MEKLADLTGYTPGSASVTFGNIKRKIKLLGEDLAANGPATPKKAGGPGRSKTTTPKSTGKRGAAKTADNESPTKRTKKNSTKKTRDDLEDDDEHFAPPVKKEEVNDINEGANDFYSQVQNAAGYDTEQDEDNDLAS
jgi:hypothetical protein